MLRREKLIDNGAPGGPGDPVPVLQRPEDEVRARETDDAGTHPQPVQPLSRREHFRHDGAHTHKGDLFRSRICCDAVATGYRMFSSAFQ